MPSAASCKAVTLTQAGRTWDTGHSNGENKPMLRATAKADPQLQQKLGSGGKGTRDVSVTPRCHARETGRTGSTEGKEEKTRSSGQTTKSEDLRDFQGGWPWTWQMLA